MQTWKMSYVLRLRRAEQRAKEIFEQALRDGDLAKAIRAERRYSMLARNFDGVALQNVEGFR
jgi:hypothetical protein